MRVYEFAKKHGVSSKDILELLQSGGFNVSTHMAQLSDQEKNFLEKAASGDLGAEEDGSPAPDAPKAPLSVDEKISLGSFAQKTKKPVGELITALLQKGILCNINQMLTDEQMQILADEFEYDLSIVRADAGKGANEIAQEEATAGFVQRAPVVVVIGHVDHGKTTLLDYIRKSRVASREKGGITQHLGAYEVDTSHGKIIFLDTPGHEAFDKMRMRGVRVADVAILIVAADDGVMPQTIEAIEHARSMEVPIIVAINKVDRVDPARIESVLSGLSQQGLLAESWGGDVVCVPVSATEGTGIDELLEIVALQAEVLELRARTTGSGLGYVLESRLEKGRGSVGTILLQQGKAQVGDYFVAGSTTGKINSILDSSGRRINSFGPSVPALVSGFNALPDAGDVFKVVPFAEYRKLKNSKKPIPEFNYSQMSTVTPGEEAYKIVIKADTNSSKEALVQSIRKLSEPIKENIVIVHAGIGNVSEGDVSLASTIGAQIFSFGVKTDVGASVIARRLKVSIKSFYVIYHLLDALLLGIEKAREPEVVEEKSGEAEVRKVFNVKRIGVIAGCAVKSGKIVHGGTVVVYRNHDKVGTGVIKTLQKEKKSLKEVSAGFECAFIVDGFSEWQEGDFVECYIQKKVE